MKIFAIVLVVLFFFGVSQAAKIFKPELEKRDAPSVPAIAVDVLRVAAQDFSIQVKSFGRVSPRTEGSLLPQVAGKIVAVSEQFREGSFFEKGDLLLSLETVDYKAQVTMNASSLSEAQLAFEEEKARAQQALINWKRINPAANDAPDLVLRKPQVAAAKARTESAQAQLEQAQLNLQRTQIRAPYAGRILRQHVDIGQVVSSNTILAEIYAIDSVQVRLPIKNHELNFLSLPEDYRFNNSNDRKSSVVTIVNELGQPTQNWSANLVRTEGAMDAASGQLFVIAQIDDPYGISAQSLRPLKIGQFVTALISANLVKGAIVVPKKSVYQDSYVYLVNDGLLRRQSVDIQWQNQSYALLSSGVKDGDLLVETPLGLVTSGTRVTIRSERVSDSKAMAIQAAERKEQRQ